MKANRLKFFEKIENLVKNLLGLYIEDSFDKNLSVIGNGKLASQRRSKTGPQFEIPSN
jgi:hypothetical protein